MGIGQALIPEFDQEMATTRRVIERVPSEKGDWKPHPKSFSLAHLTQLVAGMPGWITNAVKQTKLDLSKSAGYSNQKTDALVALFDEKVREAREALQGAKDADFAVTWNLTFGDKVLWTAPRLEVVRQDINHLVHHRGQLTVYLRLLDVKVPSIYGPTADEPFPR
jgi:uncharacterized damage-inducible protein DinB